MNFRHDSCHAPLQVLPLEGGEIHLWRIRLNQNPAVFCRLYETLDTDEKQRAHGYRRDKDRAQFIVSRGALREILAAYLDSSPTGIRFSRNDYGKPALCSETSDDSLNFNVSHSGELALVVLARSRGVGVDIEFISQKLAIFDYAGRIFSAAEISSLKKLSPEARTAAWFSIWTRKEAYLKALGKGLSRSLKEITVFALPGESKTFIVADDLKQPRDWYGKSVDAGKDYAAAVAAESFIETIRYGQWTENCFR